ncbi:hypothetical protein DW1_0419 [Proteiniborus sp. DW1]|uniref:hypothetical protein n=1 Tax=Proteiniborus sp. DW1 TaxID=1889883 RepID=UPI00092DFA33|nr:hypothetical protein [Proteiniborus sp. DW1]SCG82039.1 hypothetical protein DW1_0419 [Proteiniborus sp. DW1]
MESGENTRQYLDEIWKKVRVQEYDRYQLEKAEENKKILRKMEIKLSCLVFGCLGFMSLILYFILGFSMEWLVMCIPAFLIGVQFFEYLSFILAKRRIYFEN